MGCAVDSWLVRSSPDRAVLGRALAEYTVVFSGKALNSKSACLHPDVYMGNGEPNAGGNPTTDYQPLYRRRRNASSRFTLQKLGCDPASYADLSFFYIYIHLHFQVGCNNSLEKDNR